MAISPPRTIFGVLTDFLASNPTPEAILAYRLPGDLEQRALDLLAKHKQDALTLDEREEMADFVRADDMMTLLKAKVRLHLSGKSVRAEK